MELQQFSFYGIILAKLKEREKKNKEIFQMQNLGQLGP